MTVTEGSLLVGLSVLAARAFHSENRFRPDLRREQDVT